MGQVHWLKPFTSLELKETPGIASKRMSILSSSSRVSMVHREMWVSISGWTLEPQSSHKRSQSLWTTILSESDLMEKNNFEERSVQYMTYWYTLYMSVWAIPNMRLLLLTALLHREQVTKLWCGSFNLASALTKFLLKVCFLFTANVNLSFQVTWRSDSSVASCDVDRSIYCTCSLCHLPSVISISRSLRWVPIHSIANHP